MRVLFVTGEYPALQGGVGDYTRRLSEALGELGADVHVLTRPDAGEDHLRAPAAAYEPSVRLELDSTGWALWQETSRLVAELEPAAVHIQYQSAAYGLHPAVNFLPWYLTRRRRGPRVYVTFHDLRVPYIFPKAGPLRWRSVLALARYSDASVITNPADWDHLARQAPALLPRLRPIPIGSNIHPEPPADYDRTQQRARWGAGPDHWLLAYFGFLNPGKGGETLVRALAELATAGCPARLLMVGGQVGASDPTNAAYLAHVQGLIAELGLAERVVWTGFTTPDQVSASLLAADCAVLPYREGASLRHGSLMAALAHGLPIVTTRAPASAGLQAAAARFPSFQDGSSTLLVPPEDPAATAAAVTRVMSDRGLRDRLAQGALALAALFEWDAIARQHMQLYAEEKVVTAHATHSALLRGDKPQSR